MTKIELSDGEIQVIEKQLAGTFDQFDSTDEEKDLMTSVVNKAEALMEELDAYDTAGDDLIAWFYGKYKEQLNMS